jgi:hypothetical protein
MASDMNRIVRSFLVLLCSSLIWPAAAQTNRPAAAANHDITTSSNASNVIVTNQSSPVLLLSEQIRAECINGRRSICGRILRIVPDGVIVESGYTNLLRESLHTSWLVPGTAAAERTPNLVESHEPGAICVGTIYLTDLPRGKPHQYDYVIIAGYPEGQFTYTSVGNIQKTVRRFSASLEKAVRFNFETATSQTPSPPTK